MMLIESKFKFKQMLYLKTDVEQKARILTAMIVRETSTVYELTCGTEISFHNDFEISSERNVIIL